VYLLKLSLRPWRLSTLSQVFSSLTVGFLLLLAGFLLWLQFGLKPVVSRLQREQVITAFLDASVELKDEPRILDSIRTQVGAHSEVRLVAPHEFVEELGGKYPELAKEIQSLGAEMDQIVPRYVAVSGLLPEDAAAAIRSVAGVQLVDSSRDRHRTTVGALKAVRWVTQVLIIGLLIALVTALVQLARLNSALHRDALGMLRQWGATQIQLRLPGVFSGMSVGITGGLVAAMGWYFGVTWFATHVRSFSPLLNALQAPSAALSGAFIIAGAALGFAASVFGFTSETRG
jgi:cell division protein FtsX